MKKRTIVLVYAALLLIPGALIVLFGNSLEGALLASQIDEAGTQVMGTLVQSFGGAMVMAGVAGLGWAATLSGDQKMPGYAGLNGPGLAVLVGPLVVVGPFWLLAAWATWLIPGLRA